MIARTVRYRALALVVAAMAMFILAIVLAALFIASPDAAGHAVFHLISGIPFVLAGGLLWAGVPRLAVLQGMARSLVVAGLVIVGLGQWAESLGAFAWHFEEVRYPALHELHTVAWVSYLGLPVVGAGLLALVVRVVARWRGNRAARIVLALVGGLAALVLTLFLLVGMGFLVLG